MQAEHPKRRPAEREAFCRACDTKIVPGREMISFYSWRNRGQHIHICLPCAGLIGRLARLNHVLRSPVFQLRNGQR